MPGQLSTTRRVTLSVPSRVRPPICNLGRYSRSSVCNEAGSTALESSAPVNAVSEARNDSSLVFLERSMLVSCGLWRPPMLMERRFLHPSTMRLLSVVCVPAQLMSSVRSAVRLPRLSVCRMAWLTSVRSSPMMREAPYMYCGSLTMRSVSRVSCTCAPLSAASTALWCGVPLV